MRSVKLIILGAAALLLPVAAHAQLSTVEADLAVRMIEPPDPVAPVLDTALVITNLRRTRSVVVVVGYDKGGSPTGRVRREIPGNGLTYVLASELTDANVFLGKVVATGRGKLTGTAVLLGGSGTDLPAISQTHRVATCTDAEVDANIGVETVITFPVAVAVN